MIVARPARMVDVEHPAVRQRHPPLHAPPHAVGEALALTTSPCLSGACGTPSSAGLRCARWRRCDGRDRYERLGGVVGLVALVDRGTGIYDGDVLTASTLGEHHRRRWPGFQAVHRFCVEVVQLNSETSRIPTSNVPDVGGYFSDVRRQARAAGGYATVSIHDIGIRFQPSLNRYYQVGQRCGRRRTVGGWNLCGVQGFGLIRHRRRRAVGRLESVWRPRLRSDPAQASACCRRLESVWRPRLRSDPAQASASACCPRLESVWRPRLRSDPAQASASACCPRLEPVWRPRLRSDPAQMWPGARDHMLRAKLRPARQEGRTLRIGDRPAAS